MLSMAVMATSHSPLRRSSRCSLLDLVTFDSTLSPLFSKTSRCFAATTGTGGTKYVCLSVSAIIPIPICHPVEPCCKGLRSEEHTSELQSRFDLVCRLLLAKK